MWAWWRSDGAAQDATNVIQADVCVLTPIDLDHTAQLGGTIEEIAGVKSGIIKPGCVAIPARQTPRAARVLRDAAQRVGAELLVERVDFRVCGREPLQDGQMLEIEGMAGVYDGLALGLSGAHQAQNTALAIAASEAFPSGDRDALSIATVQRGIACVTSPGRLQRLDSDPVTIADVANNPDGAAALHAALREQFPACRRVAVIAMLTDKDHAGIFAAMSGLFHEIVITTVPCARAAAPPKSPTPRHGRVPESRSRSTRAPRLGALGASLGGMGWSRSSARSRSHRSRWRCSTRPIR